MIHNLITNKFILGTAQFGKPYGISNNKKLSKKIILDILNISKYKISELDTAEDYHINKSIKKKLNLFKVNTKVHISFLNNSYDQLEKKLKKITKYHKINTLFIRDLENNFHSNKILRKLEFLRQKKIINKIGISVYDYKNIKNLYKKFKFDVIQIPCNIFDNRSDKFEFFFIKNKIEVHARSIFLQGLAFSNEKLLNQRFKKYSKKILSLQEISKKKKFSLLNLCISHVFNKRYVSKVIFGVVDLKQLNLILNFKDIKNTSFLKVFNTTNKGLIDPRKWLHKNN